MKSNSLLAAVLICSAALCSAASATVINFDNLVGPGQYGPSSGSGFTDSGFTFNYTTDAVDVSPSGGGWSNGVGSGHSGNYAAINNYGGPISMIKSGGGTFSVQNLWLNGWQGEAQVATISGWLNGSEVDSVTLSFSSPWKEAVLNFALVDTLLISASTFLVDDIQVDGQASAIPEPGSLALIALGLGAVGIARRRRQAP